MFAHMQTLPIKYFDTHTFGDTMSHFTNDTDTLRQMISQSIPQVFCLCDFCYRGVLHHALHQRMVDAGGIGGNSAHSADNRQNCWQLRQILYCASRPRLADVNGYIEEMIERAEGC